MSINGWIKILSLIFQVDVAKRLDSVAINYDALNDLLESLDPRVARVLQLTIDEGKTLQASGDKVGVTRERVRQIKNKGLRDLRKPMRVQMLRRAISGWWHFTEQPVPLLATSKPRRTDKPAPSPVESHSCLVIANFNKPVVRVETKETLKEVVKVVEKPVTHFREPMWHSVKDLLPHHAGIVVVTDLNLRHDEGNRLMWFATFNKASREFIFANAVTALTVTHWCELPLLYGSPSQGWDRVYGRYVSLPYTLRDSQLP